MDVPRTEATSSNPRSRDRILAAAAAMLGENPAAQLSVRAVAARAGVSTGSLRHHFPTQRALQDAVLAGIYEFVFSDDPIHDTTLSARDRLVGCLRQILVSAGTGQQARELWATTYETFIAPEPTEESRSAYLAIERHTRYRVEHWLSVLAGEGHITEGDNAQRAKFLLTVVNGLSVERALPSSQSLLASETATLFTAVDSLLRTPDKVRR
ncbi:TetR/AcrR family transcriptional regulator [Streptomyces scopuliridis]|uniref:TetR/AcrR family transcriptional regulator n=1 Tax=Streptomyces scopuliridis TaxID=452529 RepID=UPI002DDAC737|nr:helix-turn-helix domain-containing protein [Streptomyces scopuliridis]WSB32734.1 TetR/AcrR family transcriptional regulator [Streptomyces scopuliridis]